MNDLNKTARDLLEVRAMIRELEAECEKRARFFRDNEAAVKEKVARICRELEARS